MSGTDPDPRRNQPIDRTQAYRPGDAAPEPQATNLPKVPGITLHFEIARGGMGVVYSGRQDFLDRRVAVKLLSVELGGESFVQRFQREAKILAGIKHPNIVSCHMAGQTDDGQSYLVMEFIDGPSLKKWIGDNGQVPVKAALRTTRAVVQALGHANSLGIIHRDVKPENILLETVTSTAIDITFPFTPKVVDLGLARSASGTASMGLTSPGSVMGTPATMSPEQFDDPDSVDFRTDIYGLGCVLYEMLVGKPAFRGKKLLDIVEKKRAVVPPDPRADHPDVPVAVAALVQSMLATNREDRPGSYRDLEEQLVALMEALTTPSSRVTKPAASDLDATVVSLPAPGLDDTIQVPIKRPAKDQSSKDQPTKPAPKEQPPKDQPPAKGKGGPGLLHTGEINFLAEGLGTPGGDQAEPAFHTTPPAGGAKSPPPWQTLPPSSSQQRQSMPAREPQPTPNPEPKRRTGLIAAVALGAVALAGVAWIVFKPGDGSGAPQTQPQAPAQPDTDPKTPPPTNRAPVVELENSQIEVSLKRSFTVEAKARDEDGDRLTYNWIVPDEIRQTAGRGEAKATFQVEDGLPGVEFAITVEVADNKNKPVPSVLRVKLRDVPTGRPLAGYKSPDSPWRLDANDGKWQPSTEGHASCKAGKARRSMQMDLGSDTYWEWTGYLESQVDDGTMPAVVGVRFEFGDRAYGIECTRDGKDDEAGWSIGITRAKFANGVWTPEPAAEGEIYRWTPPVPDDPDKADQHMGWFCVQRRGKELSLAIGDAVLPVGKTAEVHTQRHAKPETLDPAMTDPKVTLYVDQGIGRFLHFVSR